MFICRILNLQLTDRLTIHICEQNQHRSHNNEIFLIFILRSQLVMPGRLGSLRLWHRVRALGLA